MFCGYALDANGLSSSAREQFRQAAEGFERNNANDVDSLNSLRCRYHYGRLASDHEPYDRSWPYWGAAEQSLLRAAQGLARLLSPLHDEAYAAQLGYATALQKNCHDQEALQQFERTRQLAKQKGLPKNHHTIRDITRGIEECKFWLSKPAAIRSGDRLQLARERVTQMQKAEYLRRATGHWSAKRVG